MVSCKSNLNKCKAACCRWLGFTVGNLTRDKIHYYKTHGCKVTRLSHTTYHIEVPTKCAQLDDNNLCKLHGTDEKPKLCTKFDENNTKGYIIPEGCILIR